jgi:phosphoglycerate dehydrogenase-like enzyme
MEPINVLITFDFPPELIDKLQNVSTHLSITCRKTEQPEEIADLIPELDVLYTWHRDILPQPGEAPRLRWVQLHSAGLDHIANHPLLTSGDVTFTTASGIHAIQIAEYVFTQLLAFSHHIPRMFEDKANHLWTKGRWDRYVPDELYGKTLGIVGYGQIGRRTAQIAKTFGMRILAIKRNVRQLAVDGYSLPGIGDPEGDIPDRIYPPLALKSFLKECDHVVLTAPFTADTRHLINAEALEAMQPHAVLVNVARGQLIDEQALIEALKEGKIAGAALDVFEEEPLPSDSPLWELPNVIISPHIAGFTPRYDERATDLFAENLRRFISGEPLLNAVDLTRGY